MKTCVSVLILAVLALPQTVFAERPERIVPPLVPQEIQLSPDEFTPFLKAHAIGTQGYVCVAANGAYSWKPYGPQATLFNDEGEQILTHFLSPVPYQLLPTATWQHSRDSSIVWANKIKESSDPNFVAPDAIAWFLLEPVVVGDGPTGGDKLLVTRRIQRVNTVEGKAPTTGCATPDDIGKRGLVPYEADYYFYKEKARRGSDERD
jgi:hypothetical protein